MENLFSATDTLWISKDSSVVLPDVYINKIVIAEMILLKMKLY